jgi:hypothetical protein
VASGISVAPVTEARLRYIAAHFRPEERLECLASWNEAPMEALRRSWADSREAWAFLAPCGTPLCVAGITDGQDGEGWWYPWMLGTTDVLGQRIAFLRACRVYLPRVLSVYGKLRTFIDARYDLSLKWAKWLGFEVRAPAPFGMGCALFCEVRLEWAAR